MKKKALLAMLLAVTMLMSSCGLVVKHKDVDQQRAIVTLDGEVKYTKAEVLAEVNYYLAYMQQYYSWFGYSLDPTDPQIISEAQDTIIAELQNQAVIEREAAKLGLEVTDEDTAAGTTISDKLKAAVTADVTVSEEELTAKLAEKADADKTTFESNLNTYGTRVNNGTAVYYRPAGYRMVRNLLIQFKEPDLRKITALKANVTEQTSAANAARAEIDTTTELGDLDTLMGYVDATVTDLEPAITMTDLGEAVEVPAKEATVTTTFPATEDAAALTLQENVKTYAAAAALRDAYQAELDAATEIGLNNIKADADAAIARLEAGEDFVVVMNELTADPGMKTKPEGYAVCAGFTSFDAPFVDAAMGIAEKGKWSAPTAGAYGYYIIQYADDVTEGPVAMDEVHDALQTETLTEKQDEAYNAQLAQWVSEGKWVLNKDALND